MRTNGLLARGSSDQHPPSRRAPGGPHQTLENPIRWQHTGLRADICVVKGLFLFRLYYLPYNRLSLFACTGGMTDFDVYKRITYDRPVHPKDTVTDWRDGDRFRRHLKG